MKQRRIKQPISNPIMLIGVALLVIMAIVLWFSVHVYNQYIAVYSHSMFIIQTTAITLAMVLTAILVYLLYLRVIKPLKKLQAMAHRSINGEKDVLLEHQFEDEISLVGNAFNQLHHNIEQLRQKLSMSDQINQSPIDSSINKDAAKQISTLENETKTLKLELMCLDIFNQWQLTCDRLPAEQQLQLMLIKLGELTQINNIDLCLTKPQEEVPFLHIRSSGKLDKREDCANNNCSKCIGDRPFSARLPDQTLEKFPLIYQRHNYGVMVLNMDKSTHLKTWQQQIIEKIVAQLSRQLAICVGETQVNQSTSLI